MDYSEKRKLYINPTNLSRYPKLFSATYWAGHGFHSFEIEEVKKLISDDIKLNNREK